MLGLHSVGNIQEVGVEGESRGLRIQDIWGPIFVVLLLSSISDSSWCCLRNTLSFGILRDRRDCRAGRLKPAHNTLKNRVIGMGHHAHRFVRVHSHS